jgi:hypothetical protein
MVTPQYLFSQKLLTLWLATFHYLLSPAISKWLDSFHHHIRDFNYSSQEKTNQYTGCHTKKENTLCHSQKATIKKFISKIAVFTMILPHLLKMVIPTFIWQWDNTLNSNSFHKEMTNFETLQLRTTHSRLQFQRSPMYMHYFCELSSQDSQNVKIKSRKNYFNGPPLIICYPK